MVAPLVMMGLSLASSVVEGLAGSPSGSLKGASDAKGATRKTAEDFETMFLESSMDRLTQDIGQEGPLGDNGTGGSVYKSMMSKEYAKSIVKSGGIGISDQIYAQMLKLQEGAGGASGAP